MKKNFADRFEGVLGKNRRSLWVENSLFYAAFAVLNTFSLASQIKRLSHDEDFCDKLSINARKRAKQQFAKERQVNQLANLFRRK